MAGYSMKQLDWSQIKQCIITVNFLGELLLSNTSVPLHSLRWFIDQSQDSWVLTRCCASWCNYFWVRLDSICWHTDSLVVSFVAGKVRTTPHYTRLQDYTAGGVIYVLCVDYSFVRARTHLLCCGEKGNSWANYLCCCFRVKLYWLAPQGLREGWWCPEAIIRVVVFVSWTSAERLRLSGSHYPRNIQGECHYYDLRVMSLDTVIDNELGCCNSWR